MFCRRGANSWTVAVSSAQQVLCAASKAAASRLAGSTGDSSRKRKASTQRASRTGASACVGCCIVVCRSKAVHGVEPASSPYQRQKSAPVILTDVWSDDSDDEGQRRTHQNSERRRQQQEIANRREREKCRFKEWYGATSHFKLAYFSRENVRSFAATICGVCWCCAGTVKRMR